jgi:hypothetical protein
MPKEREWVLIAVTSTGVTTAHRFVTEAAAEDAASFIDKTSDAACTVIRDSGEASHGEG